MPSARLGGGAEEALLQFCRCRVAAGVSGLRVIFLELGDLVAQVESTGCTARVIQAGRLREVGRFCRTVSSIRRELGVYPPDLVFSWMTKAHIYAGIAAKLAGIPAVYFQHGLSDNGWVDRLSRLVPAAGALACSGFAAEMRRKTVNHSVMAVQPAADHGRFAPAGNLSLMEAKRRCGLNPDSVIVGIVARLQRWKGVHVFVDALAGVVQSHPRVQGLIVGGVHTLEPDYEALLKKQISALGLGDRIMMVGAKRNVPEWMAAMDVFVHASDREPFGIVVVEAMVLGKPVIATIPGGPAEIFENDVQGQLVSFGDTNALKKAIGRYLDDPAFAKKCGQAAKIRAEKFKPEIFTKKLVESLREIIGRHSSENKNIDLRATSPAKAKGDLRMLVVMPSAKDIGGAEEILTQFVAFAPAAGVDVSVCFLEDGPLVGRISSLAREVHVFNAGRLRYPGKFLSAISRLRNIISRSKPALVLSWMTKAQIYAGPAARLCGVPSVCFQRGIPAGDLVDRLSRAVPCDGFLACSDYVAKLQSRRTRRSVIPVSSAVNLDRFYKAKTLDQSEIRKKLGLLVDRIIVTIVARLQRWKGIHTFLEAVAKVRKSHPDILGVVVGGKHDIDQDYPELLARLALRLGITDSVRFMGPRTDVAEWMQASDIIVHASVCEPFGIVIIEAMSLGKPVIATKPGGPEEIITDGVDGLLVPHDNPHALSAAMEKFLCNKVFAAKCGAAAEVRAKDFAGADYPGRVAAALNQLLHWN